MTDDHSQSRLPGRVEDLEIRLAFLQKSVEELDQVVRQLGDQLGALRGELGSVRSEMAKHVERSADLAEEVPPHW